MSCQTVRRWSFAVLAAVAIGLATVQITRAADDGPQQVPPPASAEKAADVVFLCSRSKSMGDVLPQLKQEMSKSIDAMTGDHPRFDVIFSGGADGDRPSRLSDKLQPPTAVNRKAAGAFITKVVAATSGGAPKLGPALTAALALKPGKVYVTLDDVADAARAADWIKAAGKGVAVTCIYLKSVDPGDHAEANQAALNTLARATGGELKVILKKDL